MRLPRLFLYVAGLLLLVTTSIDRAAADLAEQAIQATDIQRGLCVVVGAGDAQLDHALARHNFVVERLLTDWPAVYAHRAELAEAGAFPLANAQHVGGLERLPYADHLINLLIIDLDALGENAPTEDEIKRALVFDGKAYVKQAGAWKVISNSTPDDVDEWPHALRGPDRRPISKDQRIQPHMNGLKWFNEEYKKVGQQGAGMRIADGKVYLTRAYSRHREGWEYKIVARDAQNGLLLWEKDVDWLPGNRGTAGRERTLDYADHIAAGNNRLYLYPEAGGHLTALNGDTGEIEMIYDQTVTLEPGDRKPQRIGRRHLAPSAFADPDAVAFSTVIVLGDRLLQTYENQVWLLDEKTGRIISHYEADHEISQALIGDDGHFYGVGGEKVLSLSMPDLKHRWSTPIKGEAKAFTGPQNGFLAIQTHDTNWREHSGLGTVYSLKTSTGEILWQKTSKAHSGGHLVILDGKIAIDSWFDSTVFDPATGEKLEGHGIRFDMSGCSYPTFTEEYFIRGLTLHSRENPQIAWASDGARSDCQMPTYPAYGQLYLFGSKCGCSTFMRAGISSFYSPDRVEPEPDEARLVEPDGIKALSPESVNPLALKSAIVGDWNKGESFYRGDKGWNWSTLPAPVKDKLEKTMGKSFYATRNRAAKSGELTAVAPFNDNTITVSRGKKKLWTLLLGGRVIVDPVITDDVVYVGSTDGWVIALDADDGAIRWQYQAAPMDRRITAVSHVESAWPIAGLTVWEDQLLVAAGRRDSFDGGIFVVAIDRETGRPIWKENIGRPDWKFTNQQEAMAEGYGGFGNRLSTHAGPFVANEADTAFYMYGTTPVSPQLRKNPPQPADVNASELTKGLRYSYFKFDKRLKSMPDINGKKPDATGTFDRVAATIPDLPQTAQKQKDSGYVLRFDGYLKVTEDGLYRFGCKASRSARIYLDDRLIREVSLGRWRNQSALIPLEAGLYKFRVDYATGQGKTGLDLSWQRETDQRFQPVPADALLRTR